MEIERLDLIHYGKFAGHTIHLKSGVNVIYGGNESGKSTIHSFLIFMLYGTAMEKGKKKAELLEGRLAVRDGEACYEIYRRSQGLSEQLAITKGEERKKCENPEEMLMQLLDHLGREGFQSTLCIAQSRPGEETMALDGLKRCLLGKSKEVGNADADLAVSILEERKKRAEARKKKETSALEAKIEKRQQEAAYLRKESQRLQAKSREEQEEMRRAQEALEEGSDAGLLEKTRNVMQMLLLTAGVLGLVCVFVIQNLTFRILLGCFGGLFLALFFWLHRYFSGKDQKDRELDECSDFREREEQRKEEIRKKGDTYQKLQEELEELYHEHMKLQAGDTELAALQLAIDRIREVAEEEGGSLGSEISARASQILAQLTNGRYDRVVLGGNGRVRMYQAGHVAEQGKISSATMQQACFALRMAGGELLAPQAVLPILLDESFAMYDDQRLREVLTWLWRCEHQVILFTCQQRARVFMDEIRRTAGAAEQE